MIATDPALPITDEWVADVCRAGQRAVCCRYLGRSGDGWACLKLDHELRILIDQRVATMGAKGDNCTGRSKYGGSQ